MITVSVNNVELNTDDLTSIAPQINRRKDDAKKICLRVLIKAGRIDVSLSTVGCPQGTGYFRPPNELEERIFRLWERCGLDREEFSGGQVVAFLQQVSSLLD